MEAIEDDRFARELTVARERGDMDALARTLSGRLRQMDKRAKAANIRADDLERALASEAQARRDAEGECERLRERLEIKIAALRSEIAAKVTPQRYGAALENENARLRIAFHDAIRRPLGVTPDSGAEFYDQRMADEAEARRPRAWSDDAVWLRY